MKGTIRLGNKRKDSDHKPEAGDLVFNIDRPHLLGNPFRINEKTCRATSILAYQVDLDVDMKRRSGPRYREICRIAELVKEGRDVVLMCWCHPLPCHGKVIIDHVNRILKRR